MLRKVIPSLVLLLTLFSCSTTPKGDVLNMFIGTYTDGTSKGVYVYGFDEVRGVVVSPADGKDPYPEAPGAYAMTPLENPSYLALGKIPGKADAKGKNSPLMVYPVSETSEGYVAAYLFSPEEKKFSFVGKWSTGADPCYVCTDGKILVTADYSGGTVSVFPLSEERQGDAQIMAIGPLGMTIRGSVGGPDTLRQATPHMHCALLSGGRLLCSDFSADRVIGYALGSAGLPDTTKGPNVIALEKDFGPRHILLDQSNGKTYVIGELSGKVSVIDTKGKVVQSVLADSLGARGAADIRISPDGKFLYASLRLQNDGIAIYRIVSHGGSGVSDVGDGFLEYVGYVNTGKHPRNIAVTPNGKYLLAACRDSGMIQVFSRDQKTGMLENTGNDIRIDKAVCIVFGD